MCSGAGVTSFHCATSRTPVSKAAEVVSSLKRCCLASPMGWEAVAAPRTKITRRQTCAARKPYRIRPRAKKVAPSNSNPTEHQKRRAIVWSRGSVAPSMPRCALPAVMIRMVPPKNNNHQDELIPKDAELADVGYCGEQRDGNDGQHSQKDESRGKRKPVGKRADEISCEVLQNCKRRDQLRGDCISRHVPSRRQV